MSRTIAELRETARWAAESGKPAYADAVPVTLVALLLAERDALYAALEATITESDLSHLTGPPLPEDYPVKIRAPWRCARPMGVKDPGVPPIPGLLYHPKVLDKFRLTDPDEPTA